MQLNELIRELRRTTDVTYFSIEVNLGRRLEEQATAVAVIGFPSEQRSFMNDWLKAFDIKDAAFAEVPAHWTRCSFPIVI